MSLHVKTATPAPEKTRDYWRRAGFEPDSTGLLSDGQVRIEIDEARTARPGIVLRRTDLETVRQALAEFGPQHDLPSGDGFLIAAPSGTWVTVQTGPSLPAPTPGESAAPLGSYAGISLETARFEESIRFWQALGFERTAGAEEQGWMSLTSEAAGTVSVMKPFACPHLFFNPGLTYFNSGRNPEILAELRRRGVEFAEEVTAFNERGEVDNVVLRDPGGLGVFVFND